MSGIARIGVDELGENSITVESGTNAPVSANDMCNYEGLIAAADALLIQLEVPLESVVAAIEVARKHNVLTVLDPASEELFPHLWKESTS